LICGLPKEGKSFLALSVAKALTSGQPLFGRPGFEVPEPVPVLYLAAESGDGALKLRCEKFGITRDKTKFISRTLSQGPMFGLDDPNIESLVKATFSDGAIIRYHGISPRTNHGIQTAKSPGEKFTELVRDKYRFTILKQAA